MIDSEDKKKGEGDSRFRRHEYWGVGQFFLIHYFGDHTVFKSFRHHNSKIQEKPFVTSAPHVKEKVSIIIFLLHFLA